MTGSRRDFCLSLFQLTAKPPDVSLSTRICRCLHLDARQETDGKRPRCLSFHPGRHVMRCGTSSRQQRSAMITRRKRREKRIIETADKAGRQTAAAKMVARFQTPRMSQGVVGTDTTLVPSCIRPKRRLFPMSYFPRKYDVNVRKK